MSRENRKLKRKVRNSYIISTVSISLVLFLLGAVAYLILSALGATDRLKENMTIHVMLVDDTDPAAREQVMRRLEAQEAVREVTFISKEEAAREFIEYDGTDFMEVLDVNPLPDSFQVGLTAEGSHTESVIALEMEVLSWQAVDEVVYQRAVVESLSSVNKFTLVILLFGGALLVISIILLNNTIRVSIYSRRYIISTMKLVGATRGFIRRPFLWSAFLQGVWSALIAAVLFMAMITGLREGLPEVNFFAGHWYVYWILGGMLLLGITISLVFTIFAVNKFVKMPTNAIQMF